MSTFPLGLMCAVGGVMCGVAFYGLVTTIQIVVRAVKS